MAQVVGIRPTHRLGSHLHCGVNVPVGGDIQANIAHVVINMDLTSSPPKSSAKAPFAKIQKVRTRIR